MQMQKAINCSTKPYFIVFVVILKSKKNMQIVTVYNRGILPWEVFLLSSSNVVIMYLRGSHPSSALSFQK